ncbi:MAG TPA: hypothetical protein VK424_04635 [Thermoplasmata archaeon]|nr:hypothetical protein [Thermoplasmata archaeon]
MDSVGIPKGHPLPDPPFAMAGTTESGPPPGRCPDCGALLEGPISGEVQCYLYCPKCRERFDPWDATPLECA